MIHGKARRHPAAVLLLRPAEQVGIAGVAHAQHGQLNVFVHDVAQHAIHQIQALLVGQAAHHGDERGFRVDLQAQILLQAGLVFGLARQIVHGIVLVNQRIGTGVVFLDVDAVEYAVKRFAARANHAVQPLAIVGGGDFLGVAGADGGNGVGVHQTCLHKVGAAEAFQLVGAPQPVAQAQNILHFFDAEDALVLQVVNGEHAAHGRIEGQVLVLNFQQRGHHAALPVVGVQHVGVEVNQRQHVEHRAAEKAVALVLIPAQAVDVGTAKVVLVVQEVEDYAVLFEHLHAAVLPAPAQLDVKMQQVLHLLLILLGNGRVHGQHHTHVMSLFGQHRRQRAYHVRQAARFDKRDAFACGEQNFHRQSFPFHGFR